MDEKYWIFFRGTNKLREGETFERYGMKFEKGKIYPVSKAVFVYLKAIIGFEICNGVGSKEVVDFQKKKVVHTTKSYRDANDKGK